MRQLKEKECVNNPDTLKELQGHPCLDCSIKLGKSDNSWKAGHELLPILARLCEKSATLAAGWNPI
jgi:hypothetical protein